MDYADAFKAAGAPLRSPRNNWSALAPDESFIAVTVWQHEWDRGCATRVPVLGPQHPKAERYFHNTPGWINEWAESRKAAGRPAPDSTPGWRLLREHHGRASVGKLPIRIVVVQAEGAADGSEVSKVKDARYRSEWTVVMNYFDAATGAYEYAIWRK